MGIAHAGIGVPGDKPAATVNFCKAVVLSPGYKKTHEYFNGAVSGCSNDEDGNNAEVTYNGPA